MTWSFLDSCLCSFCHTFIWNPNKNLCTAAQLKCFMVVSKSNVGKATVQCLTRFYKWAPSCQFSEHAGRRVFPYNKATKFVLLPSLFSTKFPVFLLQRLGDPVLRPFLQVIFWFYLCGTFLITIGLGEINQLIKLKDTIISIFSLKQYFVAGCRTVCASCQDIRSSHVD